MAGEFLGQDYLNAAASFGSNLGSGILSTLGSAAGAASGVANTVLSTSYNAGSNVGGYLSSLSQQPSNYINNNVSPAFNSLGSSFNSLGSSISNMPSFVSSNFNMGSLTSGLSNMNAPNVVGAASGALNNFGSALNSFAGGSPSNNLQQTLQSKFNDMVASKPQQNFGSPSPIQQGNELTSLNIGNAPQLKQDTYKEQNPISTIVGAVSEGRLPTTNEFLAPSSPIRMLTGGYVPESKQTSLLELTAPQRGTEGLLNSLAMVPAMSMERGVGGGIAKGFTRKGEKFVIEDAFKASSNYKPDLSTFYGGASKLTGDLPQVVKISKDMAGITPAATIAVGTGVMGIGSLLYSGAGKNLDNFNKEASKYNPFGVKAEDTTGQLMTYNSAMEEVPYIPPTIPQKSISDNISDFLGGLIPKSTASTYIGEDGNVYSTGVPNTPSPTPSVLLPVQSPASPNVNPVTILPQPGNVPKAGNVISYSNFEVPESVNQYMIQNNVAWNDRNQIGDQTSRNLIGTNVIDPITGEQRKINNLDESLNYLKIKMDPERTPLNENDRREVDKLTMIVARQLYSNPNEKDARYSQGRIYGFYTNELAKDVQNNQLLTDTYRYNLVKNNISIPMNTNPFAAKAESSVALLKGSDNFGGDVLSGYLPKGLGLQGAEWDRALGKNNGMLDFTPALMKMQQSGGSASPYSTLAGLTSEKDLMKMPEVFRGGPAETSGKYTISQAVLDAEGKPTYALNDKKIMAQVFKPVEITNGPASYIIPSNFISTPNIVMGEFTGYNDKTISSVIPATEKTAAEKIMRNDATVYIREGDIWRAIKPGGVLINEKEKSYAILDPHSTNSSSISLIGGGGMGSLDPSNIIIGGTPPKDSTVIDMNGKAIDTSNFASGVGRYNIPPSDIKTNLNLEIRNDYLNKLYDATYPTDTTTKNNNAIKVYSGALEAQFGITPKQLDSYLISRNTGKLPVDESTNIIAKYADGSSGTRDGSYPWSLTAGDKGYIPGLVSSTENDKLPVAYTIASDGKRFSSAATPVYLKGDILADAIAPFAYKPIGNKDPLYTGTPSAASIANKGLPLDERPIIPKLQQGYLGADSNLQRQATRLGFSSIEDMINSPAILPQQYTSGGIPIGTYDKDLLKPVKIGNMGLYGSLVRPVTDPLIGNKDKITSDRGTQGGSYTGGISNPLNIIMSPESKRVGTSGGYNIYDTNTGQVAVPIESIPNLDITGYWKKPENTPLGREKAAKENVIPAQLPLISAPVAPIRYRITSDGEQVIDTSPQITSNLDWISSGINSLTPKGTGKFVLDESGQGGDIAPTLPIMASENIKIPVGGIVANPNEFKQFANMQPINSQSIENKPSNWFFGMDLSKGGISGGLSGIGTMISSTLNPQAGKEGEKVDALVLKQSSIIDTQYIPTVNNLIGAGAIVTDKDGKQVSFITKDNANGISISYDDKNPLQNGLNTQLLSINKTLQDNNTEIKQANTKYMATAKDESANNAFGVTTGLAQKIIPEYENWMGGLIDIPYQTGLKATHPGLTDTDIKSYYQKPGNLTFTEQLKTFGAGEKGLTKDVIDPTTGLITKQTYTAPEGAFRDVVYPFAKGFIDNPRDRPLEFIAFSAMPVAFEGLSQGGTAALSAARTAESPILRAIGTAGLESTALKTGYKGLTTLIMGNMIGQEIARVPGQDFSIFNVLSGKPIYSDKLEVGKDANGNPIYADKSVAASSARAGQSISNFLSMGLIGNPAAGDMKLFKSTPATIPSKMSLAESSRSKGISWLDRITSLTSNKEVTKSMESKIGPEGGTGTRPLSAKDINSPLKGENILEPVPAGNSYLSKSSEIKPGKIEPPLLSEADSTLASSAIKAAKGEDGTIYAILKGSPGSDIQASGAIEPGLMGGIRTGLKGLLKDLDIEAINPVTYVKRIAKIATEDYQKSYESQGISGKVTVEPSYPDGYILNSKRLGQPRNPYNVEFKIKVDGVKDASPLGFGKEVKIDQVIPNSKLDLKLYGVGSPKVKGEGVWNFYNAVRTPNYEEKQPFVGLGTLLFGSPTMRGKYNEEFGNAGLAGNDAVTMRYMKLGSTLNEKFDNLYTTLKTSTGEGKKWSEEVPKLSKTVYDIVAIKKEMISIIDGKINAGGLKGKDLIAAKNLKASAQNDIDTLLKYDVQIRPSPTSKIETINLGKMYESKASEIQGTADAFGKPQKYNIDLSGDRMAMQRPFVGQVSANAITGAGLANIKTTPQSTMGSKIDTIIKAEAPKIMGTGKGTSNSASSIKTLNGIISISGESRSKSPNLELASSISKPIDSKISQGSKSPSSGSSLINPYSGSGSNSYGSSSSNSIYSQSSSSSYSPSSSSSSQSSSSMSSIGKPVAGVIPGFPWMVPPGGGGGGSGGQGRGSIVVKNPLSALSIAGRSGKFFNFGGVNNFVKSISGNTKNLQTDVVSTMNQPDGTKGSFNVVKGAASSLSEASAIARKSKKRNVVVKREVEKRSELNFDVPEFNLPKSKKNDLKIKMPSSKKLMLNFGMKKSSIKKGRL